jgi:hypothetical protein
MLSGKVHQKPNPLAPFPTREGGKFKVSFLLGERFREQYGSVKAKTLYQSQLF